VVQQPSQDLVRTGSPIADALRAAIAGHQLPRALLLEVLEARSLDLAGEAMPDDTALQTYLWKSEGALFALAGQILAPELGLDAGPAAATSGAAYGLARLLLGLPHSLSHGHLRLPQTRLAAAGVLRQRLLAGEVGQSVDNLLAGLRREVRSGLIACRRHVAKLPRTARVGFLPLALVEPYLRALERPGRDVLREPAEIAPLTRVVKIALAHWLGRI
jgi:phytoene synthase